MSHSLKPLVAGLVLSDILFGRDPSLVHELGGILGLELKIRMRNSSASSFFMFCDSLVT